MGDSRPRSSQVRQTCGDGIRTHIHPIDGQLFYQLNYPASPTYIYEPESKKFHHDSLYHLGVPGYDRACD